MVPDSCQKARLIPAGRLGTSYGTRPPIVGGWVITMVELAVEADRHDRVEWESAAAAVLRRMGRLGPDAADDEVWEELTTTTLDGVRVTPLGVAADRVPDAAASPARIGPWDIRSRIAGAEPGVLNGHALADLGGGATSLWVAPGTAGDLPGLLDGVMFDLAPVVLDAPTGPLVAARTFLDLAGGAELPAATNLGVDPIGDAVRSGGHPVAAAEFDDVARLAHAHGVLGVVVDATVVHDLGGSDGQELGYSLAVGTAYLRHLTEIGLEVDEAAALIEFRYAATDEQFETIARLRAARRCWARVLSVSGASGTAVRQRQHAVTSRPMLSRYDPYVNMLRTTVAAFAAGVGGADAVTVLPFDSPLGLPDAFGRRIARNVSHLLIEEAHVARVADPGAGGYAIERLTEDLAQAGWAEFGRIEADGGVEAALGDGSLLARVAEIAARREAEIATRKRPITGLSEFPNLAETLPERPPTTDGAGVRRYGASYEELRDDPAAAAVFLATLGPVAQHAARAGFAANLLAAGGIATEPAGPTTGVEDLLAAYGGQPVVMLAGADEAYRAWGADAAGALRAAGARRVLIAGRPASYADDHCALGSDALAFLRRTREAL